MDEVKAALQKEKDSGRGRKGGSASYGICLLHTHEEQQAGARAVQEMTKEVLGVKEVHMMAAGKSVPGPQIQLVSRTLY